MPRAVPAADNTVDWGLTVGRTERCALLLVTVVCAILAAPAAAPAAPGVPHAPVTLFTESFEAVSPPTTAVLLNAYTGAAPHLETYTADTPWITFTGCNGIVTSQASGDVTQCATSAALEALAAALGTYNGTAPAANNHAWVSTTTNASVPNLVELATAAPIALGAAGRFVAFSFNVAASSCTLSAPSLQPYVLDGNVAVPEFTTPYNPCPALAPSATSTYIPARAALMSGSSVGLRIANASGAASGNDHGIDDITVLDTTPKLDIAFTSPVAPGAASLMTLTVTNSSDLAEKAGWSFTATLPAGLRVAPDPHIATSCGSSAVGAAPGATAVTLSGAVATGAQRCDLQVGVVAATPGTYAADASNITAHTGIDPAPATAGVTFQAPVPPPPPPPPPPLHADKGKTVLIAETSGRVLVKVPGSKRYVDVTELEEIPLGSRVDARKGRVRITAEVDAKTGASQSAEFYAGIFVVTQTKGSKPIVELEVVGGTFAGCTPRAARARALLGATGRPALFELAAKKRSKRSVRKLWGKGKGSFRTKGRRSTATVRGTWWLVEDRCDGTLTRVREGRVDVRDLRLRKTIKLRAGSRSLYLAKAP